jgi:hypothetical protein
LKNMLNVKSNKCAIIVAQLGPRRHYAIPRMLHEAGHLEHFYTDICAIKGAGRLSKVIPLCFAPKGLKRLIARIPQKVPEKQMTSFDWIGINYAARCIRAKTNAEKTQAHLWVGQRFTRAVIDSGLGDAKGVYTFNSAGLELLQHAKSKGMFTVMEQTQAPLSIWQQIMEEEKSLHPHWETQEEQNPYLDLMDKRIHLEWKYSDMILCGSEYTKECIRTVGGPVEKCVVVPYGVDSRFEMPQKKNPSGPLKVLTVGMVNLNKGVPYILEAAKELKGEAVFRIVGKISISEKARKELEKHLELFGLVPRSEILQHYAWADVFLLPSVCEGSATVIYEALVAGLPVICTPNAGSVVQDRVQGFVVPIRDSHSICEALIKLVEDSSLLQKMGRNARIRACEFTLGSYKRRLLTSILTLCN